MIDERVVRDFIASMGFFSSALINSRTARHLVKPISFERPKT